MSQKKFSTFKVVFVGMMAAVVCVVTLSASTQFHFFCRTPNIILKRYLPVCMYCTLNHVHIIKDLFIFRLNPV